MTSDIESHHQKEHTNIPLSDRRHRNMCTGEILSKAQKFAQRFKSKGLDHLHLEAAPSLYA